MHEFQNDALSSSEVVEHMGQMLLDTADRLKTIDSVCPGSQAKWSFLLDGQRYEVCLKLLQETDQSS
ncbi:hypothetical protein [Polycladidibacter stylochi]|uniref:hypothetical protein n=1 Tax=Polycladidibacter stylochi TaxID=1807766 RepID=UPI000AE665EF|nr:hypothetical protein [Pseudovibrio stylochi]